MHEKCKNNLHKCQEFNKYIGSENSYDVLSKLAKDNYDYFKTHYRDYVFKELVILANKDDISL